jgi:hypothetical protein
LPRNSKAICGIYRIRRRGSIKSYIGCSCDIILRWREHIRCLSKNAHHNTDLQEVWNAKGATGLTFTILEVMRTSVGLRKKEAEWIAKEKAIHLLNHKPKMPFSFKMRFFEQDLEFIRQVMAEQGLKNHSELAVYAVKQLGPPDF